MPFVPQHVFADRARRIREYLTANGQEALIVTTPDNFYMVSGFHLDVAPWERPVAAVIPREGEPFLVMNELSTNHLLMATERKSLYITDYVIYVEHPRAVNRTYTRDQWGQLLATKLQSRGIKRGKVAVEGRGIGALQAAMPQLTFEDATGFLVAMRTVKYPEELDIMRQCAALTDWAQDRYMEAVKPGLTVAAVDFEVSRLIAEEGARRFPKDRLEVKVRSSGGAYSASPHGAMADCAEQFVVGDGIVNIIILRLSGLVVENERTVFLGQPRTDLQRRAFEVATQANLAAAAEMRPGNRVSNADAAALRVIEEAGFGDYVMHRSGHGLGIAGHEFPEDIAFNHRPFMENEVWSCEPGLYIPGVGGFRHDDTVIVTKDGPELITHRSTLLADQVIPA